MSDDFFEPMARADAPRFFSENGVAIRGIDPIGYVNDQKPVYGRPEFASEHLGITFHHDSAGNRELFLSDPARFAPQFGGYCAFAMSKGALASTVPPAWNIEDVSTVPTDFEVRGDLLYLNYSLSVRDAWRADIKGNVARAHRFWPGILRR